MSSCWIMSNSLQSHALQHTKSSLSFTISQSLLNLMSIKSLMPSSHLICYLSFLLLPSIFPSIRWPKYWTFSFSVSPSNEYSGLFRIDWFDLPTVQGTLKSLIQHHNSKASILQCPAFFMVQLTHPYMTTEKIIALTRRIFVSKVMSLLFNMLCW